jgi:alpha-1,2-mannosyltransferase
MNALAEALRSGAWLTPERVRLVALAVLAASVIGFGWLVATSDGLNDVRGRPLGTDFANVYAAGTYVLEGRPTLPFDSPSQHAREKEIFGAGTPFYGWHYPPFFLFIAAPLALMPYPLALAVWQGVTFALYLWAISVILSASNLPLKGGGRPPSRGEGGRVGVNSDEGSGPPADALRASTSPFQGEVTDGNRLWLLLAFAYPAVFVNLGHGHNGFLTAALLGGALVLLDRRPWLAGVLFGLLAYKPQFGLMIPLVLLVTGRWRTVAAAAATLIALIGAATAGFGLDLWAAFLEGSRFTRLVVLEAGNTGWHKIQSVFALVRMWGGSVPLAYTVQAAVSVAVAVALVWLWRSRADFALKAAGLAIAALLATPYSLDYDLMVLAPAIAFLAAHGMAHGFRPYEASALAALWLMPLVARSVAQVTLIPLGVPLMLLLLLLILRRAGSEAAPPARWLFAQRALK